jgi:tetratricopeptide (TPR) repeat protein
MTTEDTLTQADQLLNKGDAAGAERVLSSAWPDRAAAPAEALHTWAMVRFQQKRLGEAELLLRDAARLEPQSLRHQIALGHLLMAANNSVGAVDAYAAAMRIDRNWPGLAAVYARSVYSIGRYDEAEKAARFWIEVAPNAAAWDTLSCALRMLNRDKEALAAAEEALKLSPNDAGATHSRGAALLKLGRAQEALALFDALLAGGVDGPAVHLNRGKALLALKREREARDAFAEGVRRFPADKDLQAAARR